MWILAGDLPSGPLVTPEFLRDDFSVLPSIFTSLVDSFPEVA